MRSFYLACAITGVGIGAAIAPFVPPIAATVECLDVRATLVSDPHPRITPEQGFRDCMQQLSLPE